MPTIRDKVKYPEPRAEPQPAARQTSTPSNMARSETTNCGKLACASRTPFAAVLCACASRARTWLGLGLGYGFGVGVGVGFRV